MGTTLCEEKVTAECPSWIVKAIDNVGIAASRILAMVHYNACNVVATFWRCKGYILSVAGHILQLVVNHALKNP